MAKNPKEDLFADSTDICEHLKNCVNACFRVAIGLVVGVDGPFLQTMSSSRFKCHSQVLLRGYYQMQAMDKIQNDELAKAEQAGLITDENYVSNDIEV